MLALLCQVTLHVPHAHSLKEKRAVVRRVRDRLASRLKVQLSEVDAQDKWQRAVLGFALVGSDKAMLNALADKAVATIEEEGGGGRGIVVEREVIRFGGEHTLSPAEDSWVPPFAAGALE